MPDSEDPELRAHTQGLNALRETQLEQGQALAEQSQALTSLDQKVTDGFAMLHTGMAQIIALLEVVTGSENDSGRT